MTLAHKYENKNRKIKTLVRLNFEWPKLAEIEQAKVISTVLILAHGIMARRIWAPFYTTNWATFNNPTPFPLSL